MLSLMVGLGWKLKVELAGGLPKEKVEPLPKENPPVVAAGVPALAKGEGLAAGSLGAAVVEPVLNEKEDQSLVVVVVVVVVEGANALGSVVGVVEEMVLVVKGAGWKEATVLGTGGGGAEKGLDPKEKPGGGGCAALLLLLRAKIKLSFGDCAEGTT